MRDTFIPKGGFDGWIDGETGEGIDTDPGFLRFGNVGSKDWPPGEGYGDVIGGEESI